MARLALLSLTLGFATPVAQVESPLQVDRIGSALVCSGCAIELELVASLGTDADTVLPVSGPQVARDVDGNYYLAPTFGPEKIAVYDSSGQFTRAIGRDGAGPGEFGQITHLVVSNGLLHVFENRRRTILQTATFELEAVTMLQGNPGAVLPSNSSRVIVQILASPGTESDFVHLVGSDGSTEASFAQASEISDQWDRIRIIGEAVGQGVWVAAVNAYRLELWSLDGELLRTIERDADFFEPWREYDRDEPRRKRPRPRIRSMYSGPDGLLWVTILVAGEDWEAESQTGPIQRNSGTGTAKFWDTIIEVIDLEENVVLARQRVGARLSPFNSPGGFVARPRAAGEIDVIEILQPRLLRSRASSLSRFP